MAGPAVLTPLAARLLPFAFARAQGVLAVARQAGVTEVWVHEGTCPTGVLEVGRRYGALVCHTLTTPEWKEALSEAYRTQQGEAAQVVGEVEDEADLSRLMQDLPEVEDLLETQDDAPIIRMLNALLSQAAREGASDIHIEAAERECVVRFRVDGTLREVVQLKRALHAALISRLKIMAQLDIAEKRLPQDGRIALKVAGRAVDVRVSTLPTGYGERAVLRLLEKDLGRLDLARLGMAQDTLRSFDQLVHRPHGIVLVTGPTGSGKSTTLYAALLRLDRQTTNILTVEDPIEYHIDGIGQTPVNPRIDLTFARALRALLRQDPDVIMIGEIRDAETAQIAVQASLTGHLVLATLHTNDAVSALTRLVDMGVEPYLLSSSLLGVLAQRLVRRCCTACGGSGCEVCGQSGFRGRMGIYELLEITPTLQTLIHQQRPESEVRLQALASGMRTLRMDGQRWVEGGQTTAEELWRVTGADDS